MRGLAILFLLSGCGTNECKQGTLYLKLSFDSVTAAADQLEITLGIDGAAPLERSVMRNPAKTSDQIEIDFAGGYPQGKTLALTVDALAAGAVLGSASDQLIAAAGCSVHSLALMGGTPDMRNPDLAGARVCTLDVDTFEDGCLLAP